MSTLDEKQAELDALQAAFDEYIVSSRELEEELDAELSKCQEDLTKAQSRNAALANQLSSLSPQLTSLETKVSTLTTQLQTETQRRIAAENAAEEAENTARRIEAAAVSATEKSAEEKKWREEREDLYERLAFVEGEAEDWKRELEVERERFREEMEDVRGDLMVANEKLSKLQAGEIECNSNLKNSIVESIDEDDVLEDIDEEKPMPPPEQDQQVDHGSSAKDQEYIKTLEDELELVTEQLIEAETRLSRTQAGLEEALAAASAESGTGDENQSELIAELERQIRLLEEESSSLRDELKRVKEELELVLEELALSSEELKASEEDRQVAHERFEIERKELKDEITSLQAKLDKIISDENTKHIESREWEDALLSSEKKTQQLQEQVTTLETALKNSKADCESLQNELDDLKAAFDDASNRDKLEVMKELLATRTREVDELKEEIGNLTDTNASLSKTLEKNKQQMKIAINAEKTSEELGEAHNEILTLEGLLEEARKELSEERLNVEKVRSSLQEKIDVAQKELNTAENELESTRSKLAEAENLTISSSSRRSARLLSSKSNIARGLTFSNATEVLDASPSSEFYRSHALSRRILPHILSNRARSCSPTTYQRLESNAEQRTAATAILQSTCDMLEDQNKMSFSMKNHLEKEIKLLQKQLMDAKISNNAVHGERRDQASDVLLMGRDDRDVEEILKCGSEVVAQEFRTMAKKFSALKSHNAELLTRILKLQGNIQVGCRIRPISAEESRKNCREVAQALSETELGCFDERTRTWKSYAFDKVWGPDSRQLDVFQDVEPMALSVVDGYNACIFAYGQTGSGKTFTMEGDKANGHYGISQRTIHKVFTILEDKARQHNVSVASKKGGTESVPFEYSIEVGMLEIYNDEVYDLLSSSNVTKDIHGTFHRKSLDIRQGDNRVEVAGLTKETAVDVNEVLAALDKGNANRATSATNLNEQSSRSHMILQIEVTSGVGDAKHTAILYLVDLAGSERVRKSEVEGKAMKEAQHINKSLSALGNVMEALDQKASHVPYRDSKLTYLLQNSLGGNSRTMMIVTVSPSHLSYDESTFALKFASRVRRINLGTAHKNISAKNLEETIKNLSSQLSLLSKSKERSDSQLLTLKREKERIQEKLEKTAAARSNSKEEMKTLAVLRNSNHDITSRWQKEKAIREEKTLELERAQEQLRRVQKDLATVKRDHESLSKKMEDKENAIFELKKDLRTVKEQLNTEKIRHRRSQVVHSRIPAPTAISTSTAAAYQNSSIPAPRSAITNGTKSTTAPASADSSTSETSVARIRSRVLKILQDNEPQKMSKIDVLMKKYSGREYELLEKMTAKYNKSTGKDSTDNISTTSTISTVEDRPMSRQERALASHKARMQGIKSKK